MLDTRSDYPPEFDGPEICEICGLHVDHKDPARQCACPECPVCCEVGRLACYAEDHMGAS